MLKKHFNTTTLTQPTQSLDREQNPETTDL